MGGPMQRYSPPRSIRRRIANSGGAYMLVLIALAVVGVAASASLNQGTAMTRRDTEAQLLSIGTEFERALESYAAASPPGGLRGPMALEELLRDPRMPGLHRHLRALRPDPLSGKSDWGLRRGFAGEIIGVYSLADGQPIRRQGFGTGRAHFDDAQRYSDWVFAARAGMHERVK